MIEFWLPATILLLAALAFVMTPLLRPCLDTDTGADSARAGSSNSAGNDGSGSGDCCGGGCTDARPNVGADADAGASRTSQNIRLYHDRLNELQAQHVAGMLTATQFAAGRTEAARELLADTRHQPDRPTSHPRSHIVALMAALMVPVLGIALYLHWGSLDQVIEARQYAGHTEQSIEQMTARLETSLAAAPDSAEAWFFLGRTYLAQDRHADAVQAFERAATLAGRPPELLGHWAQALYFAGGQQWSPHLQALTDEALASDPEETASLTLAGMAAFEAGHYAEAAAYWERLAATLPNDDPTLSTIAEGIARARARISAPDSPSPGTTPGGTVSPKRP